MDAVVRAAVVYFILMVMFRLAGKRTLSQTTPFEFVLLLIISETIQQAMIDGDDSVTNGLLLSLTLIGISIGLSLLKQWSPRLDRWMDGLPVLLVENSRLHKDRLDKVRVSESDILEEGRTQQAIERLDTVEYAVLERSGNISVIPKQQHQEQNDTEPQNQPQKQTQKQTQKQPQRQPRKQR